METLILLIHLILTAGMAGLIWAIQRVHYPMFLALHALPEGEFKQWMQYHTSHITPIVGPMMVGEALTGLWLFLSPTAPLPYALALANILLIAVIFASTTLWSVPRHHALRQHGFSPQQINWLVRSNWVRLCAWKLRLILLSTWAVQHIRVG